MLDLIRFLEESESWIKLEGLTKKLVFKDGDKLTVTLPLTKNCFKNKMLGIQLNLYNKVETLDSINSKKLLTQRPILEEANLEKEKIFLWLTPL